MCRMADDSYRKDCGGVVLREPAETAGFLLLGHRPNEQVGSVCSKIAGRSFRRECVRIVPSVVFELFSAAGYRRSSNRVCDYAAS